jgi:signal transduction histidine kinase/CheY-like chemotaxis protein/HPt (histidine-containing phosphotransfer) domain-containing protein
MTLDIRTLVLVGAVIMAVSTAVFFSLYRVRLADRSPLAWGVSSAVITLGCVLLACRGVIAPLYSIIAANLLISLGYGLIWVGMRLFMDRPARLALVAIAPCALAPILAWFTYVDPSMPVRTVAVRLGLAVLPVLIRYELRSGGFPRYGRPQRVVAGLYAMEAVLNFAFALAAAFADQTDSFLNAGVVTMLFLLVCNVYMIIHVLGVVVLYGERFRREMADARDAAEAASTAKSRFLAHMSHELRTPLNGLIGMLELSQAAASDAERRNYLDVAAASAQSLLAIINDILDLSRLEAGKLTVSNSVFPLAPTLAEILAPFEHMARSRGLAFSLTVEPPEAWIEADAVRLRQITLNLTGNALKFTRQGRIDVTARTWADAGDGHRLALSVTDTGSGIAPDKLEGIFENFSQADEGEKMGGAGLGLTISRQLARLMGGDIHVASTVTEGSCFTVDIPCRVLDPDVLPRETPPQRATVADLAGIPRMRVLLADDFEPNRLVTATLLQKAGHAVDTVADGEGAVRAVRYDGPYDLVLMDVGMPGLDGLEATRLIREEADGGPPVVALTASALPGDRERFLAAGMVDYLAKPVSLAELRRVLARFAPQDVPRDEAARAAAPVVAHVPPDVPFESEPRPGTSGIDWSQALEFMGGQAADLAKLCVVLERVLVEDLAALSVAVGRGDPGALFAVSHRLRPSFLGFGARALAEKAREIENAAKAGEADRAGVLALELIRGMEAFLAELRRNDPASGRFGP